MWEIKNDKYFSIFMEGFLWCPVLFINLHVITMTIIILSIMLFIPTLWTKLFINYHCIICNFNCHGNTCKPNTLFFSLPILVAKWKIICNAKLILLQNKALRTYMNLNLCYHVITIRSCSNIETQCQVHYYT